MSTDRNFLIEKKLKLFEVIATTSVAWWVSIVVFEATIVAVMYLKGSELGAPIILCVASLFGFLFISFSVFHGFVIHRYFDNSHNEMRILLQKAELPELSFDEEYKFAKRTIINGTMALAILWLSFIAVSIGNLFF